MLQTLTLLAAAYMLRPLCPHAPAAPAAAVSRSPCPRAEAEFSNDGEDVDWDEESKKLDALSKPMNSYYKTMSEIEAPELVKEFAKTAPKEVQEAVKMMTDEYVVAVDQLRTSQAALAAEQRRLAESEAAHAMAGETARRAIESKREAEAACASLAAEVRDVDMGLVRRSPPRRSPSPRRA